MALQIINAGPPAEDIIEQLRGSVLEALPGSQVEVTTGGPGHFELRVTSSAFVGKNRVKQQQLVYGAIGHLMAGNSAPVHAIDRLECILP